jgi:hypothetical protein
MAFCSYATVLARTSSSCSQSQQFLNPEHCSKRNHTGGCVVEAGLVSNCHVRCAREIKSGISTAKAAFNKKSLFTSKLKLNLRKKLVKYNIVPRLNLDTWESRSEVPGKFWNEVLEKAGEGVDKKERIELQVYLLVFHTWMEKISLTDCVKNKEVLH